MKLLAAIALLGVSSSITDKPMRITFTGTVAGTVYASVERVGDELLVIEGEANTTTPWHRERTLPLDDINEVRFAFLQPQGVPWATVSQSQSAR